MAQQPKSRERPEVAAQRESASALIDHIQSAAENHKALLARELHDELGGLLVGAVMDLAWAEQHLSAPPAELKQKLVRARLTLAAAIDKKRKLIEDLRPTLLDNVGLYAALRWHVQATYDAASVICTITLPEEERRFLPNVPIILFRIVQEALAVVGALGQATFADFSVTTDGQSLAIRIVSTLDGDRPAEEDEPHALAAVRYRTTTLGGVFTYGDPSHQGPSITATFPLDAVAAP